MQAVVCSPGTYYGNTALMEQGPFHSKAPARADGGTTIMSPPVDRGQAERENVSAGANPEGRGKGRARKARQGSPKGKTRQSKGTLRLDSILAMLSFSVTCICDSVEAASSPSASRCSATWKHFQSSPSLQSGPVHTRTHARTHAHTHALLSPAFSCAVQHGCLLILDIDITAHWSSQAVRKCVCAHGVQKHAATDLLLWYQSFQKLLGSPGTAPELQLPSAVSCHLCWQCQQSPALPCVQSILTDLSNEH